MRRRNTAIQKYSDVNQWHMCCQWCFVLHVEHAIENVLAIKEINVKITGVEQSETTESAKITGVYTVQAA